MTSGSAPERTPLLGLNRRARWLLPIFLLLLVALTFRHLLFPDPHTVTQLSGETMGTTWSVKIVSGPVDGATQKHVRDEIEGELQQINDLMSTWDERSELSRFNRLDSSEPFPLSPPTVAVFQIAGEVSELSGGAFDVTTLPLVSAWGFGPGENAGKSPSEEDLAILAERVGYEKLELDTKNGSISKENPETEVDLSAVAKGYAVDQVAATLDRLGFSDFLVEIGGELKARGQKAPGRSWRVAIERPDETTRSIYAVVELRDLGMATSGDYRSFILENGRRRSHLIDPREGRPVMHSLASVTVVAPSTARADALATALGVMGADPAIALARRENIAAYFIVRNEENGFTPRFTPAFAPLLLPDPDEEEAQPAP